MILYRNNPEPLEISGVEYLEVNISKDGHTIWLNTIDGCLARIQHISHLNVTDSRPRSQCNRPERPK